MNTEHTIRLTFSSEPNLTANATTSKVDKVQETVEIVSRGLAVDTKAKRGGIAEMTLGSSILMHRLDQKVETLSQSQKNATAKFYHGSISPGSGW